MIVELITNYKNHLKAYRYAESTISTYMCEFSAFMQYFKGEDYRYIPRERIIEYLARLYDNGYSDSKVNQAINAIKFYKEKILHQKRSTYFLKRPRSKKFIPPIISQQRMFDVISSIKNLKHQTLIYTLYLNGLRKGELINLKLEDVRSKAENPHLVIRKAKNDSKRLLYIDDDFVQILRTYYLKYRPKTYIFEGAEKGNPISETTIARILDKAMKENGITERFRVHDLRHNFATHCLLNGTSIYDLAKFLGHKSVETTEKYYAHLLPSEIKINRPKQPVKDSKVISINRKVRA